MHGINKISMHKSHVHSVITPMSSPVIAGVKALCRSEAQLLEVRFIPIFKPVPV